MLKKSLNIFIFCICFITVFSKEKSVIPEEVSYKVIQVKSLEDLKNKYDGNYVYSLDGLDLKKLTIQEKKQAFIDLLLPNIEIVNKEIDRDIKIVKILSTKSELTENEKKEIDRIFINYKVEQNNWENLKKRMIKYPTSLILSQAALESGWGTSDIFINKNNLFGMNMYKHSKGTYQDYNSIKDSIKEFVLTLSRVEVYDSLRNSVFNGDDPEKIASHLEPYSEIRHLYVEKVRTVLKVNDFTRYDV